MSTTSTEVVTIALPRIPRINDPAPDFEARSSASFISSKEGETPPSLRRLLMNRSSSFCLRVSTVFSPKCLPDFGTNPETRHMF